MPTAGKTRFTNLRLRTRDLSAMRAFYGGALGLPLAADDPDAFTVRAGATSLEFVETDTGRPVYHFALGVPEHRFAEAKAWLASRTPLVLGPGGIDEHHFASWNARAVYFRDPAGNIGELIAHHTRRGTGDGAFGPGSIEHIVEIGLVVPGVAAAAGFLSDQLGLGPFGQTHFEPDARFAAIGDTDGMFILVKDGRPWLGAQDQAAAAFPMGVTLHGPQAGLFSVPGRPYSLTVVV